MSFETVAGSTFVFTSSERLAPCSGLRLCGVGRGGEGSGRGEVRTGLRGGVFVGYVRAEHGVLDYRLALGEVPVHEAQHVVRVPVGLLVKDKRARHVPGRVSLGNRQTPEAEEPQKQTL